MNFSPVAKLKISLLVLISTCFLVPISTFAAPSTLVIDEFSLASKTSAYDEYFKISNYGTSTYALTGKTFRKITGGGTKYLLVTFTSDLPAGKSILVTHTKAANVSEADYTYSNTSFLKDSSVYIYDDTAKRIIDLVAFGTNSSGYTEGKSLENLAAGEVYVRTDGVDTDDNATDFSIKLEPILIDPNAARLVISELLPSPASGEEWFELYNPTNLDISLANLQICDVMGATKCYFFKADDVLRGRSHKIYGHAITGITLNNTGDWLILYDFFENSLTDSGGDYGPADKGASLAVFGDDYMWTNSLTPGAANVFTSTEEIDDDKPAAIKKKVTKSKVVKASKKSVVSKAVVGTNNEDLDEDEASVKAAKSGQTTESLDGGSISKKTLGYGLIGLAILLVVGYTLWYFRDYAKEIYYKIRPGDDSARF